MSTQLTDNEIDRFNALYDKACKLQKDLVILDGSPKRKPGFLGRRKLKESITTDELKSCLAIMKDAADTGGVEDKEFAHDIGEMIGQAIERGMAKPSGQDTYDRPASDRGTPDSGP